MLESIAAELGRAAANLHEAQAMVQALAQQSTVPAPIGHPRGHYLLHGVPMTLRALADAAGCSEKAMKYRINVALLDPESAVACGKRKVRTVFGLGGRVKR